MEEAQRQLELAIDLQSNLVAVMPDSISHRCSRALLSCSLAEVLRGMRDHKAAVAAVEEARQILLAIPAGQTKHPMVERLRRTLSDRGPGLGTNRP